VPFYDSSASYDSGLMYDDPSSPQPNRRRMAKVKLGLQKLTPDQKVDLANTIKTAMTGNANFPTPNPPLATIATLITSAQTGINGHNSAKATEQTALATRDVNIRALENGMTQLADYVQNVSGGDRVKIESAGMNVRDDGAPIGTPTQVLNLVLTEGDFEGTLDVAWDKVRGASSYEIQTSPDPITPTSWAFKQSASKSSATISGLTSGAKLWVHVRAIGAGNTPGPWSDPATKVVP